MVSDWNEDILSNIAEVIDSRHKTPVYSDSGYPMVRVVDVNGGALNLENTKRVSDEVYEGFSRGRDPEVGDLVISRVGSYGVVSYVNSDEKFCLGQNTAFIIPKINSRFLYYQLISPFVKWQIEQFVVGAVQKTISLKSIRQFQIKLPPEPEQKAIAHILGFLDDKIELNSQMNETLEAMAQALFKSWFVDFDPVIDNALAAGNTIPDEFIERAEQRKAIEKKDNSDIQALFPDEFEFTEEMGWIPKGWAVSNVGTEFNTVGGGTPSTKNSDFWENGDISWTTPKDLSGNQSKILLNTDRKITELGLNKISSGLLPIDTVLMSSRAPVGYLALAKVPVAINQGYIALKCEKILTPEFAIQWADSAMDEIKQRAGGTTFAEISKTNFRGIPILVPSQKIIDAYSRDVKDLYNQITSRIENINTLAKLRDTLLPKLMSGELRIPDAETLVDETL
tara:strand:+ start:1651 stop:3006 length:1356 start_codon:yes stop_codon:yes gene_type:complete